VQGGDIAFLREFAAMHDLEVTITTFPFEGIWDLPGRDVVDVAASGISLTPDRMNSPSLWSQPYSAVRRSALIRSEDSHAGYRHFERFSVVGESAAHSHALRHLPREATLQFTPSLEHGVESLLKGETDAVGTGSISAMHQATRNERLKVLDLHTDEDALELLSFSIRREQSLLDAINGFITSKGSQNFN
jgi:ABC-type amino acid transport substrate-binding protein